MESVLTCSEWRALTGSAVAILQISVRKVSVHWTRLRSVTVLWRVMYDGSGHSQNRRLKNKPCFRYWVLRLEKKKVQMNMSFNRGTDLTVKLDSALLLAN